MLDQDFIHTGFRFIPSDYYLNEENVFSTHDLKKIFDIELEKDGGEFRKRAYLKLIWNTLNGELCVAENQAYFQTANLNTVDGGKVRQFKIIDPKVLEIPIVATIINKNLQLISNYGPLKSDRFLTIGMHFIRYQVAENGASFSSPDWLHKDDEPLVFIHLVNLSKEALGGDNLIANSNDKKIIHVIRLEDDIDTLILNKNVYHAVTPLGSREGLVARDVILFTIEPAHTQQQNVERECA